MVRAVIWRDFQNLKKGKRQAMSALKIRFRTLKIAVIIVPLISIGGCAMTEVNTAQNELRTAFHYNTDVNHSANLIEQLAASYRTNDQVLYDLERAAIHYYQGNWIESIEYFDRAENEIDRLFGSSVQRTIRAFVVNDGQLEYQGEDYEDIMTNLFKALSYIHLNDIEAARVEARRASFKLSSRFDQYNHFIQEIREEDDTDTDSDWEVGESDVQESVFGHYLTSVLWSAMGSVDSARIQYDRFRNAYLRYNSDVSSIEDLEKINHPGSFNSLIVASGGRPPTKKSKELRIPYNRRGDYILIAVPELTTYEEVITQAEAVINEKHRVNLPMIEDFSFVAEEVYKVRQPIVETRAIVRGLLKVVAEETARQEVRKEYGEGASLLAGFLGKVAREASEVADTRSWQTMPGRVYSTVFKLDQGNNQIDINFYNSYGNKIHTQTQCVNIFNPQKLHLIDVFFSDNL